MPAFIISLIENLVPGMVILGIFHLIQDPEHMEEYEKEFIDAHEHEWDHCIPSGFDEENSNLLTKLCENHVSQKELAKVPPNVDYHHIDFKKVKHHPFLVRLIRCNKNFGIIRAPGHQCAYLLKRGKSNPNIGNLMFFFHKKFCYFFRDLTFHEQEYMRDMGRLPDETILDAKNRMHGSVRSDETRPPSTFGDINSEDTSLPLSSLFDEAEESSSAEASPKAAGAMASAEDQISLPKSNELDAKGKTVAEDAQHEITDEFTRQSTDEIKPIQSRTEYGGESSGVKFSGQYVKPTTPSDVKANQPDEE